MIKLKTTGDKLKGIFTISGVCNGDMIFKFGENLTIYSRDPSNTTMLLGTFKKEFFDEYSCDEGVYGFARESFSVVNKRIKKNAATMEINDRGEVFITENGTTWNLSILGDINDRMPNPNFETGIVISMPVADFQEYVVRAKDGGSILTFNMTADTIIVAGGEYEKRDKIFSTIDKSKLTRYVFNPISGDTKAKVSFSGDFFDWIKIIPSDAKLELWLDEARPIRVFFSDNDEKYKYQYLIAPLISEDD